MWLRSSAGRRDGEDNDIWITMTVSKHMKTREISMYTSGICPHYILLFFSFKI